MKRFTLTSEFKPGTASMYWIIFDNLHKQKLAEVFSFDGSASFICDCMNWNHEQTVETGISPTIPLLDKHTFIGDGIV